MFGLVKNMNRYLLILLFLLQSIYSQSLDVDSISKSQISKLAFLVGNWEGNGWLIGRDRKKSEFSQTEKIKFKLDSSLILIEGLGRADGKVIHNALALITFNKEEKNYSFQSYLQNGRKGNFKGELIDNKFYWYPNEMTRYIIWLNEKDQWYEKGEYNREGNWFQFFEMTLNRTSE
jgi:hypothetical protein